MATTPQTTPPKDYSTPLPPAVAAAAARANKLQEEMLGQQPNGDAQPVTPPGNEPLPPDDQQPAPQPVAPQPPLEESGDWEKRYKAMKGRYDKEVPRLKEQIDTLVSDISNMRNVLSTMEVRTAPAAEPASKQPKKLITAEEEADYGEEFFTVVEKKARELIEPMIEQYDERFKGMETQIKGVGSQMVRSSVERMEGELDVAVPDWRAVNADWENNGFKEWLQLPDPYSGAIRHNLLNTAYERCDTPRVAAFFKGFHAEVAATAPEGGADPSLAPTTVAPRVPLASFAAPGRAKTAAQSLPAEKPIITRLMIQQFYRDINAGRYKGRDAERSENERAIFEAQREGRIVN